MITLDTGTIFAETFIRKPLVCNLKMIMAMIVARGQRLRIPMTAASCGRPQLQKHRDAVQVILKQLPCDVNPRPLRIVVTDEPVVTGLSLTTTRSVTGTKRPHHHMDLDAVWFRKALKLQTN
jgi:hypothetical protein